MALRRNSENRVFAGVCSGLADHLGLDAIAVRLAFVAAFLFFGSGPLIYIIKHLKAF